MYGDHKIRKTLGLLLPMLLLLPSLLLLFAAVPPSVGAFSGSGSGTSADPYVITNVTQLQEMNNALTKYYVLGNDIDATATRTWNDNGTGGYYGFEPVGASSGTPFTGTFNGASYKIINLYINRPSTTHVGLFGYVGVGGVVKNVGVENENIAGNGRVGGVVGSNYAGTLSNSYSTGFVTGNSDSVGGLAGYCVRSGGIGGTVDNCYSTSTVSGSANNVGGLVGWFDTGSVSNSFSTGSVSGTYDYIGGFIGRGEATISNSFSTGPVSGREYVGGFRGKNDGGTVSNCFWDNQTSGKTTSDGGTGKTTDNMKNVQTYTDTSWSVGLTSSWDFVGTLYSDAGTADIWGIRTDINGGYPYLVSLSKKRYWVQTTQADFNRGVLENVDTTTQADNAILSKAQTLLASQTQRDSYYDLSTDPQYGSGNSWYAQSFKVSSSYIDRVEILLQKITFTGSLSVYIVKDNTGKPYPISGDYIVGSGFISYWDIPTYFSSWNSATVSATVTPNTTYWLVVGSTGFVTYPEWKVYWGVGPDVYADGTNAVSSTQYGTVWYAWGWSCDFTFKIYSANQYYSSGALTSQSFNTGAIGTIWESIYWGENKPSGTGMSLYTSVSNDNLNWGAWGGPYTTSAGTPITSARAKYIKWKVVLTSSAGDNTPVLTDVTINYTLNSIPTKPTISPSPATVYMGTELGATASGSTDNDSDTITYYYKFYNVSDTTTIQNWSTDNTYVIQQTDAHNTIRAYVKAGDGYENSAENYADITVTNTLPTTPTYLVLSPATAYVGNGLSGIGAGSTDGDGDTITYYYTFYNKTDTTTRQGWSVTTSYTLQTADAHDNVVIYVRAYDGYGYSDNIENFIVVSNSTPTVPAGTTDLGLRETNHAPTVSWTASTDSDLDTIVYYIETSADGVAFYLDWGGAGSFCVLDYYTFADGEDYWWRVRAYDGYENSGWAPSSSGDKFQFNQVPTATALKTEGQTSPTKLTTLTPTFSWTYSDPDSDTQSHYEVWVGTALGDNSKWAAGAVAGAQTYKAYSGTTLSRGTIYYVQVRTKDGYEWGGWATGTFQINILPSAPTDYTNLGMNLTDHTPAISWTKGTDADGDTVATYIYCDTSSTPTTIENSTTGTAENLGENSVTLTDGATYYYRLRSGDGYEYSDYTTADQFRMNSLPTASNQLADSQTNPTRLTIFTPALSWTYSDAQTDVQTQRQVQVGTSSDGNDMWDSTVSTASASATYAGSALSRGVTYYWRAKVYDGYEWSSWCSGGTFRLNQLPITPLASPADGATDQPRKPTLKWTFSDSDGGLQTQYQLQLDNDVGFGSPAIDTGALTGDNIQYTSATSIPPSTLCYWRVKAYDGYEWSDWTEYRSFTIVANAAPTVTPLLVDGTENKQDASTNPSFSWTYSDADGDAQSSYQIQVGVAEDDNSLWGYAGTTGDSIQYGGASLLEGTTYYVRMRAYDNWGWSGWSRGHFKTATITTPPVTTQAATSVGDTTATLNGEVTSDGGATITERGYYCDTSTSPTTKYTVSGTTRTYTKGMTGLSSGTKYYFKAFATNSKGTSYGSVLDFTTSTPTSTPPSGGGTPSPTTYAVSVNITPAGAGAVSGVGSYAQGASVTLAATPASGYQFSSWSGYISGAENTKVFTMPAQGVLVTATFATIPPPENENIPVVPPENIPPSAAVSVVVGVLTPGENAVVVFENKNMPVMGILIVPATSAENVSLSTQVLATLPEGVEALSNTLTYSVMDISISVSPDTIQSAIIAFAVERAWLEYYHIGEDNVVLLRWSENTWQELLTFRVEENATHIFYAALSPGFSLFAVAGRIPAAPPSPTFSLVLPTEPVSELTTITVRATNPTSTPLTKHCELRIGDSTFPLTIEVGAGYTGEYPIGLEVTGLEGIYQVVLFDLDENTVMASGHITVEVAPAPAPTPTPSDYTWLVVVFVVIGVASAAVAGPYLYWRVRLPKKGGNRKHGGS